MVNASSYPGYSVDCIGSMEGVGMFWVGRMLAWYLQIALFLYNVIAIPNISLAFLLYYNFPVDYFILPFNI